MSTSASLRSHNRTGSANLDAEKSVVIDESGQKPFSVDKDPNIISWDGPDDPKNPMNWSRSLVFANVGIVSALTFITPLASSMFAPGVPQLMEEFHSTGEVLGEFVVSVYILGFAVGPLLLAPLSEMYGRLVIYHISNVGFIVFSIACGVSTDLAMLIVFRFLQGCFGAAPVTNGGGTIADTVHASKRGGAIAIYALGPLLGPVVGPVCGGYLVAARGWRWVFWVLCIVEGFLAILSAIFLRETYAPVLLKWKTRKLMKQTGNLDLRSELDDKLNTQQRFQKAIIRPVKMLVKSPIVLLCSLYMAVVYGYLYLMFTTFTIVFQGQYGISTANVGLTYLGIGVGSLIGLFIVGSLSDRFFKKLSEPSARNPDGSKKPEFRLPLLIATSPLIPIGLFIYGWTAQYRIHWIVPIIGTALVGIGNIGVFMCIQTYLIDAFTIFAASAIAASTVIRSIFGAFLPLAGESMYQKLGLGWGNSLLAFIAVALLPVPVAFMVFGQRLREALDVSKL